MADILIRDIEPEELSKLIADAVSAELSRLLEQKQRPRLVDRTEMAELISIGTAKLDSLVSTGVIPSKTIGTRRLFDPAEVIEALN